MNTPRLSAIALTLIAVGAAVALLAVLKRRAARREECADILAQSQDMVSEGGPAET